jgi:plastocyanin
MKLKLLIILVLAVLIVGCAEQIVEEPVIEEESNPLEKQIDQVQEKIAEVVEEKEEPIVEEVIEEPLVEEMVEEVSEESGTTHIVKVTVKGFDPNEITIKVGDSIQWENARSGNLNKALILGSQQCTKIKSKILLIGDTFTWKFDKAETCTMVDAITTTQIMKVRVEE